VGHLRVGELIGAASIQQRRGPFTHVDVVVVVVDVVVDDVKCWFMWISYLLY